VGPAPYTAHGIAAGLVVYDATARGLGRLAKSRRRSLLSARLFSRLIVMAGAGFGRIPERSPALAASRRRRCGPWMSTRREAGRFSRGSRRRRCLERGVCQCGLQRLWIATARGGGSLWHNTQAVRARVLRRACGCRRRHCRSGWTRSPGSGAAACRQRPALPGSVAGAADGNGRGRAITARCRQRPASLAQGGHSRLRMPVVRDRFFSGHPLRSWCSVPEVWLPRHGY
jgi:hypothetical protein